MDSVCVNTILTSPSDKFNFWPHTSRPSDRPLEDMWHRPRLIRELIATFSPKRSKHHFSGQTDDASILHLRFLSSAAASSTEIRPQVFRLTSPGGHLFSAASVSFRGVDPTLALEAAKVSSSSRIMHGERPLSQCLYVIAVPDRMPNCVAKTRPCRMGCPRAHPFVFRPLRLQQRPHAALCWLRVWRPPSHPAVSWHSAPLPSRCSGLCFQRFRRRCRGALRWQVN